MGKDQLAVFRGRPGPRPPRPTNPSTSARLDDEPPPTHPLSILALAASIRLDDPRQEHERVVMLEIAIEAGREAARALDRWLLQSLAEYRGSRSVWDLEATTAELRHELGQFDELLRDTAGRLIALIPGLTNGTSEIVSLSESRASRRRVLYEVVAVSSLLDAVEQRLKSGAGYTDLEPGSIASPVSAADQSAGAT